MRAAAWIPSEIWKKYLSGEIHHFVYHAKDNTADAVYIDGRVEPFDTTVTEDYIEQDKREMLEYYASQEGYTVMYDGELIVSNPRNHYQIVGFTS